MFPTSSANSHNMNGYFVDPLPFSNFSSLSIPSSPFYLYHDPDPFPQPLIDDVISRDQSSQDDKKKKKDRHSKINTAQGPRDRRMRLSIEVARKFFHLQDMLEFDKASKTVEWLLNHSKSAITNNYRLNNNNGSEGIIISSPCSSDVVSGVFDELVDSSAPIDKVPAKKEKKLAMKTLKSRGIVARESRKQARVRAKERTMEKMWIRKLSSHLISNPAAAAIEEEYGTAAGNNMKPSNMEELDDCGTDDCGQFLLIHSHLWTNLPRAISFKRLSNAASKTMGSQ